MAGEDDKKVIKGEPKDGDELKLDGDEGNQDDGDSNEGDNNPPKQEEEPEWKKELRAMEQKLARLEGENAALRQPKQPAKPKVEEPDWEELLFTDPKNAIGLLKKQIREEVVGEVTSKYQKAEGEKEFWGSFYRDHDDLKDDDDLVKATLSRHLNELADLPVKKAAERLAELTRDRIMRYTGQNPKGGKKAVTEGANPPSPGKKEPEKPKVVTLSDIIKARRAKRLNKAQGA